MAGQKPVTSPLKAVVPQAIWAVLEALFAKFPAIETVITDLESAVGSANINWTELLSVVGAALASGGGPIGVIIAILANLGAIIVKAEPATIVAAAQSLVESHGSLAT